MTAITPPVTAARTQSQSRSVDLFSGRAIAWITLCLGAPSGLLLMALNWDGAGQASERTRYIVATVVASAVAIAAWLNGSLLATLAIVVVNIVVLFHLRDQAERCGARVIAAGNGAHDRNAWQGIGLALVLALAMAVPAYAIRAMLGA